MPDPADDIALRGWGPVTVRVAWTLASHGARVAPEVLRDARDHVWFHLPPDTSIDRAVDATEPLVAGFVARAFGRRYTPPFPGDVDLPLPPRWRDRLWRDLTRNAHAVLRRHLVDGHPLEAVARQIGEDVAALEAAREGLREVLRRAAPEEGLDLEDWKGERVDHYLHRLASLASRTAPPLVEVVDGLHPDALATCAPSARAYALVRHGQLKRADLVPPHGAARPLGRLNVVVAQLHPKARRHRDTLLHSANLRRLPVADDTVVLDVDDDDAVARHLVHAAEQGLPERDHLRGAYLKAPGRWSKHGLLGPLAEQVADATRAVSWGSIEGLVDLPEPLPAPPSARWAWSAALAMGLVAVFVADRALAPAPPPVDHPLEAVAVPARQGFWLDFDVDEDAYVFVVRASDHDLDVVLDSAHIADKVTHATGDGRYRLHTVGDEVLLASASGPIPTLADHVAAARAAEAPLEALARRLRAADPAIDVRLHRRR